MPNSTPPNRRFGHRLSEAISAVARHNNCTISHVEEELVEEIGKQVGATLTHHAVQHWKKGYPPTCERMQVIVSFCIKKGKGRISYDLAKELLQSANCEHLFSMLDAVFPQASPRPGSARRPFPGELPQLCNIPHRRNHHFTGRASLLTALRDALMSGQPTAWIQAISGLGGVGKTQIAVEYVYRYAAEYDVIWWVQAREPTVLATDYAGLAGQLPLLEQTTGTPDDLCAALRRWLENHPGWLLVFDDAAEPAAVYDYLPRGASGHVLITSRNPNWRSLATPLPVRVLERTEAVAFLQRRTGKHDEAAADALAELLGDLPLALAQAGAHIEMTGTFGTYRDQFAVHHEKLLRRGTPSPDYPATVATTWELAFQQVQGALPAAVDFLFMCAFLAPDNIRRDMLCAGRQALPESLALTIEDAYALDEIAATLRRYSLIESTDEAFSVHPLVQLVIRDRLPADAQHRWIDTIVALLQAALAHIQGDMDAWSTYAHLLPHALQAAEHARILPRLTTERAQRELALRLTLGPKLMGTRGYGDLEVQRNYDRARELAQQEHLTPQLFPALFGLWTSYHLHAQHDEADALGRQLFTLANQDDTPDLREEAHLLRGCTLLARGKLRCALNHFNAIPASNDPEHHQFHTKLYGQDPVVTGHCHAAHDLWLLGYPQQALHRSDGALECAQQSGSSYNQAFAQFFATVLHYFRREVDKVQALAGTTLALATEHGFPQWEVNARILHGWALVMQGQGETGMAQMRQGVAAWRAMGSKLSLPILVAQWAEGAMFARRGESVEAGLRLLTEAQEVVEETGECWWAAEIARLQGVVFLQQPGKPQAEAEIWLQRALDVARCQEAKSLELRAAMSLSRLWQQQGKRQEAHDLLAEVYAWFTEGFDTVDLQEAKALLEAVGG